MSAVVIANSAAGQRRPDEFHQAVERCAAVDGVTEVLWTTQAGDACRWAAEIAAARRADTIIAAGGDGTVNEIVTGILSVSALGSARERPAVGILPLGTCNVLASELGLLTLTAAEIGDAFQQRRRRALDIGLAGERYFLLMAGYGFDGAAVRDVIQPMKSAIGATAYILSAVATLARYKPSHIELTIDGDVIRTEAFMVLVANVSSYGFRDLKFAPFASPDDGWLDVCLFEKGPVTHLGFVAQFLQSLARRHLGDPHVRYYRGRSVEIAATPVMPEQIDGEAHGATPTRITILPRAVEFIVPALTPGR